MRRVAIGCGLAVAICALVLAASGSTASRPWAITNLVRVVRHRYPLYVHVRALRLLADGTVYWTAETQGSPTTGPYEVFRWRNGRTADLGSPGPGLDVLAVNDHEQFVVETAPKPQPSCIGSCVVPEPPMHGYLWQNRKLVSLGSLGGKNTYAGAINDQGQIVGSSELRTGHHQHAFLWQHGRMTDLGTLGGSSSYATAINDRGQVIGTSSLQNLNGHHAFLWQDGKLTDIGTLGGGTSDPVAINDRGQVIGQSTDRAHPYEGEAFFWQHGKMTAIGSLDLTGYPISCEFDTITPRCAHPCPRLGSCRYWRSVVTAIDDRGDVVGMTETDSSAGRAFLWHAGKLTDLGTLGGWSSGATAIDDRGDVVGWSETKRVPFTAFRAPGVRPFVWHAGKMTELPTQVGEPTLANSIGSRGPEILGGADYGWDGNQLLLWRRVTS